MFANALKGAFIGLAALCALGAAPAQALTSFGARIDATLAAVSAPEGVGIDYAFGNRGGYAMTWSEGDADWSDDFVVDDAGLSVSPGVSGSVGGRSVIEAASLNEGQVVISNLTDAVTVVDFVLSYELVAEAEVESDAAMSVALANLELESLDPEFDIAFAVDAYAGGDYGEPLDSSIGRFGFQLRLSAGQSATLALSADTMGRLESPRQVADTVVPLPGAGPMALAGMAALGGLAWRRRRARG